MRTASLYLSNFVFAELLYLGLYWGGLATGLIYSVALTLAFILSGLASMAIKRHVVFESAQENAVGQGMRAIAVIAAVYVLHLLATGLSITHLQMPESLALVVAIIVVLPIGFQMDKWAFRAAPAT